MRSSVFDPSGSRVSRLTVQIPIEEEETPSSSPRPELVKCPELLLTGLELEQRTTLRILHKKGRRFESPWEPFFVGIHAHALYYYAHLGDWPRAVVPLVDADIKAVDRIFRHGDAANCGDDCGPCWKVTSCSGRVLLFRAPSHEARMEWIEQLRQAAGNVEATRKNSMDGKAALALARRLSRSSSSASSTSASSMVILQSPRHHLSRRRKRASEDDSETSEMLRDALRMVEKQRHEIEELQKCLEVFEAPDKEVKNRGRNERQGRKGSDELEARAENDGDKECHGKEGDADGEELDLDAMLDDAAMEISKLSRGSAVSDVLSEDDEVPGDEHEDGVEGIDAAQGDISREDGREHIQNVSLVVESAGVPSPHEDEQYNGVDQTEAGHEQPASPHQECMPVSILPKQEAVAAPATQKTSPVSAESLTYPLSATSANFNDAAENESIQQQAAELAEMARNLNKDDLTDSSSTRESSEDGSLTSSFKGSHTGAGIFDSSCGAGNDFLQQQAMELAEIARNLQSSFRVDPKSLKTPLKSTSSSSSLLESQTSFSDVTDFGLNQINSNDSNDSIFSITQDDLYYDDDEEGEIERLSEFDASDSQFLEASGFLDSIHQVMKDFIVSSQPEKSRQPDQLVISDEIIAEIRQRIDTDPSKETDDLEEAHHQRALRTGSPATGSTPFLRVFGSRNRLSHLIRWAIEIEVASVINVATLFRSDDYASRLVSTYSKAIGSKFIRVALSDPIHQIFKLKIAEMELNPHKEESLQDEAQAYSNAANLMKTCQNIIDSIMKNTHCIPSSYFHICSDLNSKVISRFDGSKEGVEAEDASTLTRSVIGGFLFLRFVCPAITTPHLYGLTKQLPPPETRRVLVLVTKLLFKTATGVKFGDREPQFKVLNPFIEKNSPAIQQLFANLAMSPSQDIDECFASDSRKIYSHVSSSQLVDDLAVIRSVSEKNLDEIEKKLEACDCDLEVTENFKAAVLTSADPLQKNSLSKKLSANMKFLGFGKKPRKQSDQ
uniref:Ras-GAP domain-containing protein n=1 Tax=Phytophthora ramorum TaxID=164328 RepID=H3GJ72_PHYRM